ncbi:MAG: aminotransferase class I/II-fold pyridoxal phosphate-dependent enzyme [Candidatus Latescibacteria bacterium]|nr:aminotransferase class I/II-fold pyridoxal phosphate-dependent enzyme [Candidatus Latescibacterota bacterium]
MSRKQGFHTDSIHAGESHECSATPIHQASTVGEDYLRGTNPTLAAFEEKIRTLEGGKCSISTGCGMAAVSQTLMSLVRSGGRVICHHTMYYWATHFITEELRGLGIASQAIDMRDTRQIEAALAEKTDVVYFEPLANPSLDTIDTPAVIEMAHAAGARVVIDNTYLTPYLFRPLECGADVVLHSATKYLSGHGDSLAGVITTNDEDLGEKIVQTRNVYGGILNPMNAFLLLRGIKTLPMRMDRHCSNAQAVAEFLASHPNVRAVFYPGLTSAHGHEIASAQWRGFGGMISFEATELSVVDRFMESVELCRPWVSLGDTGSLVTRQGGGARVRMSVGLEDIEDILGDLDQALS